MDLRTCPDCGGPVSRRAKSCPRCARPMRGSSPARVLILLIVVPLLLIVVSLAAIVGLSGLGIVLAILSVAGASAPAAATTHAGDIATLELPGGHGVWMAMTDADWDDLIDAENDAARGGPGAGAAIYRMAVEGRARKYPNGTPVRVLKVGFLSRFVAVIEGEDRGRSGWVQVEFVRPARAVPPVLETAPADPPPSTFVPDTAPAPPPADPVEPSAPSTPTTPYSNVPPGEKSLYDVMMEEDAARATAEAEEGRRRQLALDAGRRRRADSLLKLAGQLDRAGKARGALDFYRRIVAEYPGLPQAEAARGRIKALAGE